MDKSKDVLLPWSHVFDNKILGLYSFRRVGISEVVSIVNKSIESKSHIVLVTSGEVQDRNCLQIYTINRLSL